MKWKKVAGLLLVVLAVVGLGISFWPVSYHSVHIPFSTAGELAGTLSVSQPDRLRVGNKGEISLNIVINQGDKSNQEIVILSELEVNNLKMNPVGEGKVTVDPAKPFNLKWSIMPLTQGVYSGTLWLFFESENGEKQLILARPLKVIVGTLLGFSVQSARAISILVLIIGLMLFFIPVININKAR